MLWSNLVIASLIIAVWWLLRVVRKHERTISVMRTDHAIAIEQTKERQRGVVRGKVTEHLIPWVKDIGDPSLMRFLGSPIDLISFENYDNDDPVVIKFIEVKTGSSRLTKRERRVRDAVVDGRVEFVVVNIDD